MIVECSYCESKTDARVVAQHDAYNPEEDPAAFTVFLLECPSCKNSLVAGQYLELEDGPPTRLWPSPDKQLSDIIPPIVGHSMEEAAKCFKVGAYSATAVMCGRALEGICRVSNTKSKFLGGGLKELKEMGLIDSRILKWGEELQRHRNIGAHATDEKISKEDARDLVDFLTAICDYIFVLNEKYNKFMKRKEKG